MVLGKKEIGAALLALGAIVFYAILLSVTPSGAQTGGGATGGQSNAGCANPQTVQPFTGSQNQITPSFDITGSTFQISYQANRVNSGQSQIGTLDISAVDQQSGLEVPSSIIGVFLPGDPNSGSQNVLEGPGTFTLRIEATNVQYTVTVSDCVGTAQNNPTNQGGTTSQSNQRRGGKSIINIPKKPLPPSGGLPVYGVVVASVLAGVALLGLGLAIRRGR